MQPNLFLKTFWQPKLRPIVFVAMSFAPQYDDRFKEVFEPSIRLLEIEGHQLEPFRVDLSRSGDSILTEIIDGIAHAQIVLADVSTIGKDSVTGEPFRNGNVMYEVGLALACRQPSEVLLVRDDRDKFLFDVSTIPHMHMDFSDTSLAITSLTEQLQARLLERSALNDARVQMMLSSLTTEEIKIITQSHPDYHLKQPEETVTTYYRHAFSRLTDKHVVRLYGKDTKGNAIYCFTPLGKHLVMLVQTELQSYITLPAKDAIAE